MLCYLQENWTITTSGGDRVRDDLERVNVVLTKEQHQRFRLYSRKYHGSVSQFLRLAGEKELDESDGADDLKLRPIYERLDKTCAFTQSIQGTVQRLEREMEFITRMRRRNDYVANHIEEFLSTVTNDLSIPEITGYLPYDQEQIVRGIEILEERFAVIRIKQVNGPSKWKIRSDSNENT